MVVAIACGLIGADKVMCRSRFVQWFRMSIISIQTKLDKLGLHSRKNHQNTSTSRQNRYLLKHPMNDFSTCLKSLVQPRQLCLLIMVSAPSQIVDQIAPAHLGWNDGCPISDVDKDALIHVVHPY